MDTHLTLSPPRDGVAHPVRVLADLLATTADDAPSPVQAEAALLLLHEMSFPAVLQAIEQSGHDGSRLSDLALYRLWLAAGGQATPHAFAAWFNLGAGLSRRGDRASACLALQQALALRPGFHPAAINLGLLQEGLGEPDAALATWSTATQDDTARTALLNQRARLLETRGRLTEAEALMRASLLTQPQQPDVIQHWVHVRQKLCLWPVVPPDMPGLDRDTMALHAGPLGVLAWTDDIDLQRRATAAWIERKTRPAPARLSPTTPYGHPRLRIGYLSSDLCKHAMSYLLTELIERHDRGRVEATAYCFSREDGSDMRVRVLRAFDRVRPLHALDDEAAARLIRADEIDVLIDLNGMTAGARPQILRWRPAPLQATYLGFVGPVALPELDYLLCDDMVIPPTDAALYHPRPAAIGPVYQPNLVDRRIGATPSRIEAGLPGAAFVLCSFCNHYKITPEMFAAWTEILHGVEHAVLWLADEGEASRRALLSHAAAAGIDPARLIFAPRVDPADYMARMALGDLFLDTTPYNAGTVASDAIRMGLPIVTLPGRSFASRMAGRLLAAIGAHDGIAASREGYVAFARHLARDPDAHAAYRALFGEAAWRRTLGDMGYFTATFEDRLIALHAAHMAAFQAVPATCREAVPA